MKTTKKIIIEKIKKYIRNIIDKNIKKEKNKDSNTDKATKYRNEKDLLDIINETNNINIIVNAVELIYNKYKNTENNNIKEDNKIESIDNKIEHHEEIKENKNIKINKKRNFNDTTINYKGDYNKQIKNINNKIQTIYNFSYDDNNLLTRFIFKNKSKNFEFYYCYKAAKGCPAKAKLNIKSSEFIVYIKCNENINHEKNTFENFEMIINNGKLENIDINLKCNQRYYIRYLFKNKIANDKITSIEKLKNKFGDNIVIKLTDNDINNEKSKLYSYIKDDNLLSLINSLKEEIKDIIIKTYDIIYEKKIKVNNEYKTINREEEIIYFGNKEMFENLNNINITQYFLDFTYKIIPHKYKPYRLMTLKGFDTNTKNTKLCCLIAIKYEDEKSIYYTIKYLTEFYKFKPKIINIDYSKALYNSIYKQKLFNNECLVIRCFFHFSQSIIRKMKELKIFKQKINKLGFEILLNIQIISFIKPNLITKYLTFLKSNLKSSNECKLFNYLEKYWIKLNGSESINYYDFIKNIKNEKGLEYLYITNIYLEYLITYRNIYKFFFY